MADRGTAMSEIHYCLPITSLDAVIGWKLRTDELAGPLEKLAITAMKLAQQRYPGRDCVDADDFFGLIREADRNSWVRLELGISVELKSQGVHLPHVDRYVTPMSAATAKKGLKRYIFSRCGQLMALGEAVDLYISRLNEEFLNKEPSEKFRKMIARYEHQQDIASGNVAPLVSYTERLFFFGCRKDVAREYGMPEERLKYPSQGTDEERARAWKDRVQEIFRSDDAPVSDANRDNPEVLAIKRENEGRLDSLLEKIKAVLDANEAAIELGVDLPFASLPPKRRKKMELAYQAAWKLIIDRDPGLYQKCNTSQPNKAEVARLAKATNQTIFVRNGLPEAIQWGMTVSNEFDRAIRSCQVKIHELMQLIDGKEEVRDAILNRYGNVFHIFLLIDPEGLTTPR